MSMKHFSRTIQRKPRSSWSSVAFIVESILLLVFLVASLAVLTQVFATSLTHSVESRTLDASTIAATSVAERFAADPEGVQERTQMGDLVVMCDVTAEQRNGGTMYYATIAVHDGSGAGAGAGTGADAGEPIYTIQTSRYESGVW